MSVYKLTQHWQLVIFKWQVLLSMMEYVAGAAQSVIVFKAHFVRNHVVLHSCDNVFFFHTETFFSLFICQRSTSHVFWWSTISVALSLISLIPYFYNLSLIFICSKTPQKHFLSTLVVSRLFKTLTVSLPAASCPV